MSILSKIFSSGADKILDSAANVIDKVVTNDKERQTLKNELSQVVLSELNTLMQFQSNLIKSEMEGNWLQRSWRPVVMLMFSLLVVVGAFVEIPYLDNDSPYWSLLELGLGGYVIGRSVEKVAGNVTKNIDLSSLRKKDRKDYFKVEG